ncbi:MAG: tripartite tricarboxylate transporter substrate binding protein [Betaproteobacteria bacterium]|nr:tripartite tricarboxylate transporter substrate binding protein [Betaproteobacteria bacterium]
MIRLSVIAAALPLLTGTPHAIAQAFPVKPIRMLVAFPPGGIVDLEGRAVAKIMEDKLGVSVVVENRPGAGGLIGTRALAAAAPDGYTLGTIVPSTASAAFQKENALDVFTALTPIGSLYIGPLALSTNAQTPARTVKEFIDYGKANPGKLNIGVSSGPAAMAGAVFAALAGIKIEVIEYNGAAPAMTALLGNQVQANFGAISQFTPHLESGKVVALAVGGDQRMPAIPNVPTMAEMGLPGVKSYTVHGVMGPAGLPPAVMSRLLPVMKDVQSSPELDKLLRTSGKVLAVSNEEFTRLVREEIEFWTKAAELVAKSGR